MFVSLGLPKLLMQIARLCIRLFVKKTFFALEVVADQAFVEVADAGNMIVAALEDALDIPKVPLLLPPPPPLAIDAVKLAAQAALSVIGSLANASENSEALGNSELIGKAVERAVSQTLSAQNAPIEAPQSTGKSFSLPGWILVCIGGLFTRVWH